MTDKTKAEALETPRRPVLRWHGGKWRLAPWIISHFPPHRVYVEPFDGAASVLLRKPRSYAEVYNDLDDDVVNLFRVLQRPADAARLIEMLQLTPFARREFEIGWNVASNDIERARLLIIRAFMGFGSNSHNAIGRGHSSTGFRANSNRRGTTPAMDWANYPECLRVIVDRLRGVVVEHRDAIKVMLHHDTPLTLHYVDPPYLPETRARMSAADQKCRMYRCEMTREDHVVLLNTLRALKGFVMLSGYPAALYDDALPEWRRVDVAAFADGARKRTEVLWINPQAYAALDGEHLPMFAGGV